MTITFLVNLLFRATIAQIGVIQINNKSITPGSHERLPMFLYKMLLINANKSNVLISPREAAIGVAMLSIN